MDVGHGKKISYLIGYILNIMYIIIELDTNKILRQIG